MTKMLNRKARSQLVIGISVLSVCSAMLTQTHNDFAYGLGFGIGIGFLLLGIYGLKRQ